MTIEELKAQLSEGGLSALAKYEAAIIGAKALGYALTFGEWINYYHPDGNRENEQYVCCPNAAVLINNGFSYTEVQECHRIVSECADLLTEPTTLVSSVVNGADNFTEPVYTHYSGIVIDRPTRDGYLIGQILILEHWNGEH